MTTYLGEKPVGIGTIKATEAVGKVITDKTTILGDGFTDPLKVNTLLFATAESVAGSAEAIRTEFNNKLKVVDSAIDGANDAIAKTRNDYEVADQEIRADMNEKDAELEHMITEHAEELVNLRGNQASLGTQVANIEHKIPDGTTGTNSLVNKQILAQTSYTKAEVDAKVSSVYKFKGSVSTYNSLPSTATTGDVYNVTDTGANYAWDGSKWDKLSETIDLTAYATTEYVTAREQDIRSDLGEDISEVHTQVVGLSGEVVAIASGKQDKLTAGENITIEDGVISATGGGDYLPLSGGELTGKLKINPEASATFGDVLVLSYGDKDVVIKKSRYNKYIQMSDTTLCVGNLMPSTTLGARSDIGSPTALFGRVYTAQLSGSTSYSDEHFLTVPNKDGTLARLEDLEGLGGTEITIRRWE